MLKLLLQIAVSTKMNSYPMQKELLESFPIVLKYDPPY